MTKSTKSIRILTCIAAAGLFLAAGPPAQAGSWGGKFDPIGMFGTDLINISGSNCLPGTTAGGFFLVNGFGATGCTATLLNASVTLTNPPPPGPFTDTAQLTFSALNTNQPFDGIWGIDLAADGTLLGVDSFLIGPKFTGNPAFPGPWWIQLDAGDGQSFPDPPPTGLNTVLLFTADCSECQPFPNATFTADLIGNKFDPVPEPGSLALLAGALGAGWLTRRRKAAA
jgi:hypothetical protein